MSDPEFDHGFAPNVNVVSRLPAMIAKRTNLQRQLRQVERDIAWLERKQALAEFVATDRINSARTDIPTLAEVLEWDGHFRANYTAKHQERNEAVMASTTNTNDHGASAPDEDPLELLAKDANIQALDKSIDDYFEDLAKIRGAGFGAAEPLVGVSEPKLSTLTCPPEYLDTKMAWWTGVYQRVGLL